MLISLWWGCSALWWWKVRPVGPGGMSCWPHVVGNRMARGDARGTEVGRCEPSKRGYSYKPHRLGHLWLCRNTIFDTIAHSQPLSLYIGYPGGLPGRGTVVAFDPGGRVGEQDTGAVWRAGESQAGWGDDPGLRLIFRLGWGRDYGCPV